MASTAVIQLAQKLGVPLSNRSVSGGWLWDGKTLGLYYQDWNEEEIDHLHDNARLIAGINGADAGSAWFDQAIAKAGWFKPDLKPIVDSDLLHDMAHHLVAPEWLRDLPEWGLGVASEAYGANGGYHLLPSATKHLATMFDPLVEKEEANRQEALAWLLGRWYCLQCGIDYPKDWLDYWLPPFSTPTPRRNSDCFIYDIDDRRWVGAELVRMGLMLPHEVERAKVE